MLGVIAALAFLGVIAAVGVVLVRRIDSDLTRLESIAYGAPLGAVLTSLGILLAARVTGLAIATVLVASAAVAAAALGLILPGSGRPTPAAWSKLARDAFARVASSPALMASVFVVGFVIVRWLVFWAGAMTYTSEGLVAMHINVYGDMPVHLGNATAFAFGDNFPPEHPRFAGHPLAYHHLSDLTAAALIPLGLDPAGAVMLHSAVFSIFTALAIVAFALRLTRDSTVATLAFLLFVVGGSLAWTVMVDRFATGQDTIGGRLWAYDAVGNAGYRWVNVFYGFLMPQRAFLYGLPLGFLSLTLVLIGLRRASAMAFVVAGAVLGLLPLAHLSTMLAMALVTPFLVLAFPRREWIGFFAAWILVAVPQLLLQQGGAPGALAALRVQMGWVAGDTPWPIFWLKQVGLFLPLLLLALAMPRALARDSYRLLAAFMPIFVIANVLVFQPWDWDNHKVLAYWFFATCVLVAGLLVWAWRRGGLAVRGVLLVGVASMLFSGVLEDVNQLLGHDRYVLFTAEEIQFAADVREGTDPHAVFATGTQNNHPVPTLAGRRVVMGYSGWLFTEGLPYQARDAELRTIFAASPDAKQLLQRYDVDYVVLGPNERDAYGADVDALHAAYPVLLSTQNYELLDADAPAASNP